MSMLQHNLLALYLIILFFSSLPIRSRCAYLTSIWNTKKILLTLLTCLHYYDFDLVFYNNRMSPVKRTIYVMQVFRRRRLSSLMDRVCTWDASLKFQKSWRINKYPGTMTPRRRDGKCYCYDDLNAGCPERQWKLLFLLEVLFFYRRRVYRTSPSRYTHTHKCESRGNIWNLCLIGEPSTVQTDTRAWNFRFWIRDEKKKFHVDFFRLSRILPF